MVPGARCSLAGTLPGAMHEQSIGGARRLHAKFGMRASERRPRIIADIPNLAWCRLAPPIDCSSVEMPLTLARDFFQRAPDELRVDAGGGRGGQELAGGDAGLGALLTRRLGRRAKRRDLEGGGALQHARRVAGGERGNRMLARAAERGFGKTQRLLERVGERFACGVARVALLGE